MSPALFTRASTRPNRSSTVANAARTASGSPTSHGTATARSPRAPATVSSLSAERASSATLMPAAWSTCAIDAPMPCDAPVTTATLPSSSVAVSTTGPYR